MRVALQPKIVKNNEILFYPKTINKDYLRKSYFFEQILNLIKKTSATSIIR